MWDLPPVAFRPIEIGGRIVLVSAGADRFCVADLAQALVAHGPLRGSRESKHRTRTGTLLVLSNAAKGEVVIATTDEIRLLRGGLGKGSRSEQRRRRSK